MLQSGMDLPPGCEVHLYINAFIIDMLFDIIAYKLQI